MSNPDSAFFVFDSHAAAEDAIRTLGLNPIELLVLPRVLALLVSCGGGVATDSGTSTVAHLTTAGTPEGAVYGLHGVKWFTSATTSESVVSTFMAPATTFRAEWKHAA